MISSYRLYSLLEYSVFLYHLSAKGTETICDDGIDNDGDSVPDCSDNDCKSSAACKPDGKPEKYQWHCRDWVDNDEDGVTDCDDQDCQTELVTSCNGSWDMVAKASPASPSTPAATQSAPKFNGSKYL